MFPLHATLFENLPHFFTLSLFSMFLYSDAIIPNSEAPSYRSLYPQNLAQHCTAHIVQYIFLEILIGLR